MSGTNLVNYALIPCLKTKEPLDYSMTWGINPKKLFAPEAPFHLLSLQLESKK